MKTAAAEKVAKEITETKAMEEVNEDAEDDSLEDAKALTRPKRLTKSSHSKKSPFVEK